MNMQKTMNNPEYVAIKKIPAKHWRGFLFY